MGDSIDRQEAIDAIGTWDKFGVDERCRIVRWHEGLEPHVKLRDVLTAIVNLPAAQPEQRWIPIKWHDCTDEDREKYGFSDYIAVIFDCDMPSDEQEILVTTTHGYIEKDVCYIDEGFSLDSGYDWVEDIIAWMPLPKPYEWGAE